MRHRWRAYLGSVVVAATAHRRPPTWLRLPQPRGCRLAPTWPAPGRRGGRRMRAGDLECAVQGLDVVVTVGRRW
ncbi:hypothetical protein I553_2998 [Mycobacterium xenopi 4042]|uniref:Uncharacterized protein n=1 Tax=Mycobacterium xenopi 4042 TaxID=1299334 RepID=X8ECR3_MYCXE|nr:hypothetical protein I553_2998 [Mycobacterium xenopi 4042]